MKVYYLSLKPETPNNDYWDYGLINDLLKDEEHFEVSELPKTDKAIVLLPARHHAGLEKQVNEQLNRVNNCVFFAMGDEEADFEIEKIEAKHIWVQNPHPDRHDNYNRIGTGYPPQIKEFSPEEMPKKKLDLFFSGQVTHERRRLMMQVLEPQNRKTWYLNSTRGFTQGLSPAEYYEGLQSARIAPCPSGAVIPDSFRLFEALESMTIAIADEVNPSGTITSYWDWMFNDLTPFIKIQNWSDVIGYMNDAFNDYHNLLHKQTAWWIKYKRDLKLKIKEQYNG